MSALIILKRLCRIWSCTWLIVIPWTSPRRLSNDNDDYYYWRSPLRPRQYGQRLFPARLPFIIFTPISSAATLFVLFYHTLPVVLITRVEHCFLFIRQPDCNLTFWALQKGPYLSWHLKLGFTHVDRELDDYDGSIKADRYEELRKPGL